VCFEVELLVTAKYINKLGVAQQWFCDKLISAIMQKICISFLNR
jgi:hypothetical protein